MSLLSERVYANPRYSDLTDPKEKQKVLDEITPEILAGLTAQQICDHTREVYDTTVQEYVNENHNQGIIFDLAVFMNTVPQGGRVLDVGCGVGRDALFMSCSDPEFRRELMNRTVNDKTVFDLCGYVPQRTFRVIAIDSSAEMLNFARSQETELSKKCQDMKRVTFMLADMHQLGRLRFANKFDGIFCCTSLLTHTPAELVKPSIESLSGLLNPGGVLFISYTNGRATGIYDKLKLSQTGFIKYFSQPDPEVIEMLAERYSLKLERQTISDFEVGHVVKVKNLFVAQFFRKT